MKTDFRMAGLRRLVSKLRALSLSSIVLVAVLYFLAARFGLAISAVNKFAALVWPPSGIALGVLLIFGRRLWPAIFIGAFFVNWMTGASPIVALGIATGNTLEGLLGLYLCRFKGKFRNSLDHLSEVSRLVMAAVTCSLVSATVGVLSLWLGGTLVEAQLPMSWMQWWAGDTLGILAITPLLLVFGTENLIQHLSWHRAHWSEKLSYIIVLTGTAVLVLSGSQLFVTLVGIKGVYILVPVVLWGAVRFGQRGSVIATFAVGILAIWYTSQSQGPFADGPFMTNLLHLLIFVITMSVTGLFVAAVVSEREIERQAADSANLAKSAFLANMSHEIRTPLAAVIGFAELVAEPGASAEERANYVATIRRNGEVLSNLINDILDLSKVEAGKMEANIREIAVSEILKDTKLVLDVSARKKSIDLEFVVDKAVPKTVRTDPLRLRQILINIVGNAIKFSSKGRVLLTAKMIHEDGERRLAFAVKDSGIGIRPEDAKRLFSPFSQVDPSAKRRFGGTGLGLALSRRLAALLGGNVVLAESVVGEGSTFVVSVHPGELGGELIFDLKGVRILLVEDSPDHQALAQRVLLQAGAEVELANNGREALERALKVAFDIILMDLQMPVMDGYESTRELRRSGYKGRIIALTAHALDSERQRCLDAGFDEHLSKPINRDLLVERLSHLA